MNMISLKKYVSLSLLGKEVRERKKDSVIECLLDNEALKKSCLEILSILVELFDGLLSAKKSLKIHLTKESIKILIFFNTYGLFLSTRKSQTNTNGF